MDVAKTYKYHECIVSSLVSLDRFLILGNCEDVPLYDHYELHFNFNNMFQ